MCGKCGCIRLCPCSFGLALGLTGALAVLFWSLWVIYAGGSPMMPELPVPTWKDAAIMSLIVFVKGFVFGFVLIYIYDKIASWCMKKGCCRKAAEKCECNKDKTQGA
jgi:hypothetical protein